MTGGALEVEDDPRPRVQLAAHANLPHDVVGKVQRGLLEGLDGQRVVEIHEHARRPFDALVVERHFALEFQRDAKRVGQHLTANRLRTSMGRAGRLRAGGYRSGLVGRVGQWRSGGEGDVGGGESGRLGGHLLQQRAGRIPRSAPGTGGGLVPRRTGRRIPRTRRPPAPRPARARCRCSRCAGKPGDVLVGLRRGCARGRAAGPARRRPADRRSPCGAVLRGASLRGRDPRRWSARTAPSTTARLSTTASNHARQCLPQLRIHFLEIARDPPAPRAACRLCRTTPAPRLPSCPRGARRG